MSGNFSAASLEATQNRVKQLIATITEKVNKLGSISNSISGIVAAGSGSVAASWSNIGQGYNQLSSKVEEQVTAFAQDLTDYVTNTLENETTKQAKIDSINDSVTDLMQRLGQI